MRPPLTAWRITSSAISFRLPSDSIPADASSDSPLSFDCLWAVHSTAFAVSFPLSDLRCFRFLSSASVLDSDYSASVLLFLLFPVPPHSCFPGARIRSRFLGFLFLPGLISHAFLPGSCTWLRCSFPFALSCFAPTAVPQVLTFRFHFRSFPLPACFLSSACFPFPATQPSALPFLFFPVLPCSCFPGAPPPLSLSRFPLSLRPGFPCLPSRFLYSALLLVSFRPSLIRSHSCSSGAYLVLSLSVFSLPLCFLSSALFPVPATQPLFLPFLFLPDSASQQLSRCALSTFVSLAFHFRSARFPVFPFCFFVLGLSVSFLSSFPVSLPQPLSRCFPYAFAFGLSPYFAFFRPLSFGSDYSAFRLSFSFFPFSPVGGSHGAAFLPFSILAFLFRPACFHAVLPIAVLSFLQFLSPYAVLPHSGYLSASAFPFGFRPCPLCFCFRLRLLGSRLHSFVCFLLAVFVTA